MAVHAQAPVANFTSNVTAGCGPLIVNFKDLSTNNPTSWLWDFGDGQTSTGQNPSVTFPAGTYTVTLIAKNASGPGAIRQTNYITVYPYPTPIFGENLSVACAPANVQFIDYSTPGQGASIVSWAWAFGDGSTSNLQTPSHTFAQPGYYNIGLTVTNSNGCSNSTVYTRYLRVVDGVQPNFTWKQTSTSCSAPYALNFVNQTAGPGNLTYNWSLGTGATPAASTDTSPAGISYPSAGTYNVTLSVASSLGCSQTITQAVPLSAGGAVINGPSAACLNIPISFSDGSSPTPISSSWDFGDGTTSNLAAPTHTYTAPATYTVTLTSTSASCSSTTTRSVTIGSNPTFPPSLPAPPRSACQAPLTVKFTDNTLPAPAQEHWDFGDGQMGTGPNPSHTYTTTGQFDVKLTITNAAGCSGTTTMTQLVQIRFHRPSTFFGRYPRLHQLAHFSRYRTSQCG